MALKPEQLVGLKCSGEVIVKYFFGYFGSALAQLERLFVGLVLRQILSKRDQALGAVRVQSGAEPLVDLNIVAASIGIRVKRTLHFPEEPPSRLQRV